MNYFKRAKPILLFEPLFLKELGKINEGYVEKHDPKKWDYKLANDLPFDIPITDWLKIKQNDPFHHEVSHKITQYVYLDWERFSKTLSNTTKEEAKGLISSFIVEAKNIRKCLATKKYLRPIVEDIGNLFERIINDLILLDNFANQSEQNIDMKVINLPEGFNLDQLKGVKTNKLTVIQAALLFKLMAETRLINTHSGASFGKIASPLFSCSAGSFTNSFNDNSNINSTHQDDLSFLKKYLSEVISNIDSYLDKP